MIKIYKKRCFFQKTDKNSSSLSLLPALGFGRQATGEGYGEDETMNPKEMSGSW